MIAAAASDAALGLDVCAKRSRSPIVQARASELAQRCRALALAMGPVMRTRMADRMRWEWLASTASLLEPTPERRIVAECLQVFDPALDAACAFRGDLPLVDDLVALIRAIDSLRASLGLAVSGLAEA
jgi:hypothetical protein